jgi:hypothetical protein
MVIAAIWTINFMEVVTKLLQHFASANVTIYTSATCTAIKQ